MELKIVQRTSIVIEARARDDYGDIDILAESMKRDGVIQPLAVRDNGDGTYRLLAGGRRMKAAAKAGIDVLPVRVYDANLSEQDMLSIELMENIARKDLTWLEQARLKTALHNLQVAIHGQKLSTSPDAKGWSMADTAKLLGRSPGGISDDIRIARAAEAIPDIAGCATKQEAAKLLAKMKERMIIEEKARRAKESQGPAQQLHEELTAKYVVTDFFKGVKEIPDGSIKLCEVDPPYAIDLPNVKKAEKTFYGDSYNEVHSDDYPEFMQLMLNECYRVLAPDSWLILWYAIEPWAEITYQWAKRAGFTGRRLGGFWIKTQGQTKQPDKYLGSAVEPFYYLAKGSPVIVKPGRINAFNYKGVPPQRKVHPTERPIELIQDILSHFVDVGSNILVPFAGSGNTLLACANLGLNGVGFDLSEEYYNTYVLKVHMNRPPLYKSYIDKE